MFVRSRLLLGAGPSWGKRRDLALSSNELPDLGRERRGWGLGSEPRAALGSWSVPLPWTLVPRLRSSSFPGWWKARWGGPWDFLRKPERAPTPKPFWPAQRKKTTRRRGMRQVSLAGELLVPPCLRSEGAEAGSHQGQAWGPGVPLNVASWSL